MQIGIDTSNAPTGGKTHAVFVVVPRFNMVTLITMIEELRVANYLASETLFSWEVLSFDGPQITASNGMAVTAVETPHDLRTTDMLFVIGSWGSEHYQNRVMTGWIRQQSRRGATVCAVELGCYIVARAGLLSNREATTHWSWLSGFAEKYDDVEVVEQLYTINGRIMTCAGGLAGVDLMLRLIEDLHGLSFAQEIADQMLYHPMRPAEASQRGLRGARAEVRISPVQKTISLIERNIEDPLGVPELAKTVGVSQRQLERLFKKQIGCTVVQFGLLMRLQHARVLLISGDQSVREIATASGFNTLPHFAYSFGKFFGRRPSEYRESWPTDQVVPSWPGTLSEFLTNLKSKDT